jgi:hypothetical protein
VNKVFRNVLVASFCLVGALALYFWRADGTSVLDAKRTTQAADTIQAKATGSVISSGADGVNLATTRAASTASSSTGDWTHTLVAQSKSAIEALRLLRSDSRTTPAALKYFEAFLAETCSSYSPASQANPDPRTPSEIAQKKLTSLSYASYCVGMERLSAQQIAELWSEAAKAGDKRAIALQAWRSDYEKNQADQNQANGKMIPPALLSTDMTQKILDAVATRDPSAVMNLGKVLSQTSQSNYLALENGQPLSALRPEVWSLLACDFGMDCSQNNSVMLAACAHENVCNYDNLEALYKGQYWTQEESAKVDQSRELLRDMIATGSMQRLQFRTFDGNESVTRTNIRPSLFRIAR